MIMGPFGLNGFILDISGDILFGWLMLLSSFRFVMAKARSCGIALVSNRA